MTTSWITPILKKLSTWIALIILISMGLNIFLVQKSCKIDPGIQERIDQLEIKDEELKQRDEAYDALKGDTEDKIAELNGTIDSSNFVIEQIKGIDGQKAERIRVLEARTFPDLTSRDDLIDHWKELSGLWEERFLLSRQEVEQLRIQNFSLVEKYNLEVVLRLEAEELKDDFAKQAHDTTEVVKNLARRLSMKSKANLLWKGVAFSGWLLAVVKGK